MSAKTVFLLSIEGLRLKKVNVKREIELSSSEVMFELKSSSILMEMYTSSQQPFRCITGDSQGWVSSSIPQPTCA